MNDQLSKKKSTNVLGNTDDTQMSIDDFLSIDPNAKKTMNKLLADSSLSITLGPMNNSEAIKTSANSVSKTSDRNSLSITLQPKPKQNLSSATNNSSPSISSTHSLPSTSSCSVNNIPQQSLLQCEQEATSTLKMPHELFSNTVTCPEKLYSSELLENKTPVISRCTSLAGQSDTHNSNSGYSTYTSQRIIIMDDDNNEGFKEDNGFIFEISKRVKLPSWFWMSIHRSAVNETTFYQLDYSETIVKEINFYNSLVPIIKVYDKNYKLNSPIKTQNQLQILLNEIDSIENILV